MDSVQPTARPSAWQQYGRQAAWLVLGSALLHVVLLWPLYGFMLGRDSVRSPQPKRPVELSIVKDPTRPPTTPKIQPRPAPVREPRAADRMLAERSKPKDKRRIPRITQARRRVPKLQPRPRPRPRPRPKPKKKPVKKKPVKLKLQQLKMVEQARVKPQKAPKDARYLAEQNRNVRKQTRARNTNLDKHSERTHLPARSKRRVGWLSRKTKNETRLPQRAPREKAGAQRKAPRPRPRRVAVTPPRARPRPVPKPQKRRRSILAMRNRKPNQDQEVLKAEPIPKAHSGLKLATPKQPRPRQAVASRGQRAVKQRRRLKLRITPQDADKVFGRQWAAEWKQRHARRGSKGPKSRRWARVKAALENYTPEVRVGNQTALKTRAHPFAKYIAFMHRKIHTLWGNGFLEDLQRLPAADAFNDWSRHTKLEIVLDNRGRVVKAGVVRPSGFLPFDVAALDVVFTAAPFGAPPAAILSPDGRAYLHWGFYRNQRQCGTFNVNPFILAKPRGPVDRNKAASAAAARRLQLQRLSRGKSGLAGVTPTPAGRPTSVTPHHGHGHGPGQAHKHAPSPAPRAAAKVEHDPRALSAAIAWFVGFMRGKPELMLAHCRLPFTASGKIVAKNRKALRGMLAALIAETPKRLLGSVPKVISAAQLRQRLGSLPRGIRPGRRQLFVVQRFAGADLVLILGRNHRGQWQVTGLAR